MRFVMKEAKDSLIKKLELPNGGQDWEIEISSSALAIPLLKAYQERDDFTEDEKYALMITIYSFY